MKIILFGCGTIGHKALHILGAENVECFCDNNINLAGTVKCGKTVISFEELLSDKEDVITVICAGKRKEYVIAEQLEMAGVKDYIPYSAIDEKKDLEVSAFSFLSDALNRSCMRTNMWREWAILFKKQVGYLMENSDIRRMKAATGDLRKRQLEVVKITAAFLAQIKELGLKPFLYAGNLLGYVRHNGFIPWDDDMDLALIREEYEELKRYCRRTLPCKDDEDADGGIQPEMYYYKEFFDHFSVFKLMSNGELCWIDFFSMDYYDRQYEFKELAAYADRLKLKYMSLETNSKKIAAVKEAIEQNGQIAKDSEHIYFGLDNMCIFWLNNKKSWISRDTIFPLQTVVFEGAQFWVPNRPEEFLQYLYTDIWDFPEDVGIPKHL